MVAAHLRSFFEKVGSLPRVFIVYICAHTFPRYTFRLRSLYFIGPSAKFPPAMCADPDISARRTTSDCESLNL